MNYVTERDRIRSEQDKHDTRLAIVALVGLLILGLLGNTIVKTAFPQASASTSEYFIN